MVIKLIRGDELRISNIRRYNGKDYSLEEAKRFRPDKNTLLLYHFDGDTKGQAPEKKQ
jgi:hypothetical protein